VQHVTLHDGDARKGCVAELRSFLRDRVQHDENVGRRVGHDAQYLVDGRLLRTRGTKLRGGRRGRRLASRRRLRPARVATFFVSRSTTPPS
jgi:hypothetical protein